MARTATSPWRLFRQALGDYANHWTLLVGIVLVVGLPVALLTALKVIDPLSETSEAGMASAYANFAQLAMNAAIIYAVVRIVSKTAVLPAIRQAYYKGSEAIIRLFLVSFLLVITLLFLLLGIYIIAVGVLDPGARTGGAEQALLTGLGIIVALPTLWLLPRSMWALYLIFESGIGPMQAVKASWRLTAGRTWSTLGYLAALIVFLVGLMALPVIVLAFLQNITHWALWSAVLQVVAILIVVPISNLYLYRYLRNLPD